MSSFDNEIPKTSSFPKRNLPFPSSLAKEKVNIAVWNFKFLPVYVLLFTSYEK